MGRDRQSINYTASTTEAVVQEIRTAIVKYSDGIIMEVSTTPSPYFQTWFCNGGKGSKEFTDRNGESLLHKNWDGMGIEIHVKQGY